MVAEAWRKLPLLTWWFTSHTVCVCLCVCSTSVHIYTQVAIQHPQGVSTSATLETWLLFRQEISVDAEAKPVNHSLCLLPSSPTGGCSQHISTFRKTISYKTAVNLSKGKKHRSAPMISKPNNNILRQGTWKEKFGVSSGPKQKKTHDASALAFGRKI